MSKVLPYLEMNMLEEDKRPETDIVDCKWCHGTGKEDWRNIQLGCYRCYGTGRLTLRRKRAMELNKEGVY